MQNCLFCKIISKEIPGSFVYEDSEVAVFKDINPKGRVHLLVVPVQHVNSFLDLEDSQLSLLTKMAKVIQTLVREQNIEKSFYTLLSGGKRQEVPHLHWHLIGD